MKTDRPITLGELYRLKGIPPHPPLRTPLRTPYNTGKVKIGCHYVPPMLNRNTETTDYWQGVYMGDLRAARRERLGILIYTVVAAVGFAVGFWFLRGV